LAILTGMVNLIIWAYCKRCQCIML